MMGEVDIDKAGHDYDGRTYRESTIETFDANICAQCPSTRYEFEIHTWIILDKIVLKNLAHGYPMSSQGILSIYKIYKPMMV